jgi:hypothetical protein
MPPPNESPSDLEQRLANVVLAEVLQQRTRRAPVAEEPATKRFVRGTLDEGDTLPFALEEPFVREEPTLPSTPYELVAVEQDVEFSLPFERPHEPAFEPVAMSASSNLVMDTAAVAKVELEERARPAPAPPMPPVPMPPVPPKVSRAKTAPIRQKTRGKTRGKTRAKVPGKMPSYVAMAIATVLGALAFVLGLGLARLMM